MLFSISPNKAKEKTRQDRHDDTAVYIANATYGPKSHILFKDMKLEISV
jgi:hypothetical protein